MLAPARPPRHDVPPPGTPVPRDAEAILARMLEERPEDRCPAAAALTAIAACADYPRSGCDALRALLCERFPQLAPVRGQAAPTPETHERPRPLLLLTPGRLLKQLQRRSRRRTLALLSALGIAGALSGAAYLSLRAPAAAELRELDLELPSPVEPPAAPAARFAAPERAAPERAPASPKQQEPKPSERTPVAPPEAPDDGFRIIKLFPERPEPSRTGDTSWIPP